MVGDSAFAGSPFFSSHSVLLCRLPCGTLMLGSYGDELCLCDWKVEKHRDHVYNILSSCTTCGTNVVIYGFLAISTFRCI